jgi:hypothetical protein
MHIDPSVNFDDWASELHRASGRSSAEQDAEFLRLVDAAHNCVSSGVAAALMRTFSALPDYGTQERVCSVLASGSPTVVIQALLSEMPRLAHEAVEWAGSLLCTELEHRASLLVQLVLTAHPQVKSAVLSIVSTAEFREFQPKGHLLLAACQDDA